MEINAANVAWHKNFHGKPIFRDKKKMDKKSRFGELSTEEIQEIVDNAVPVTTKEARKFGVSLFKRTNQFKFPIKVAKFEIRPSRFYAFMNSK